MLADLFFFFWSTTSLDWAFSLSLWNEMLNMICHQWTWKTFLPHYGSESKSCFFLPFLPFLPSFSPFFKPHGCVEKKFLKICKTLTARLIETESLRWSKPPAAVTLHSLALFILVGMKVNSLQSWIPTLTSAPISTELRLTCLSRSEAVGLRRRMKPPRLSVSESPVNLKASV